jgi:hypothetical protein
VKIRTSFVGNSSSSSFINAVPKEIHEKIFNGLTEFQQSIINQLIEGETKFLGKDLIILATWSSPGGNLFEFLEYDDSLMEEDEDDGYDGYSILEEYLAKVVEISGKDSVFSAGVSW